MSKKSVSFLLPALFIMLYLLPLAGRPLFIQDETRYAEVPREMLQTGDWVVPRINGLRYFEKPVMGYWLTAASLALFGENNFAVRLPSALATGFTAILIFFLCYRSCRRDSSIPYLAVLVYLSSLGVAAIGTFAVLDTPLTFFLTATLGSFFVASEQKPGSSRERTLLFLTGIVAGCAFLTKGFLAFAVPVLTVAPYLLLQRRWRDTLRMLLLPVIGAILISLPWSLLIHQRQPDFWHYFFWNEHVRRFLSDSAQHSQPFWFFFAVLPPMLMPWILLLPAAGRGLWTKHWTGKTEYRLFIFCLCWFLFPFLFFSASSGKLITYILPCFPPLAILFGLGLDHILSADKTKNIQQGIGAACLLASFILLSLVGLHLFGPDQWRLFERSWKWLLLSSGLVSMLLLLTAAFRAGQPGEKITLFALSFAALLFVAHFTMPNLTLNMNAPGPLILRNAAGITPATLVLSGEDVARAVCWYLKRDDVYTVERAGELQYGLGYPDSSHRLLNLQNTAVLIRNNPGQVVLIANQEEYSRWQPFLPPPVYIDSSGSRGYLFLQY
jgi:4-amino-4-deoxy-L-arabinose transferase